MKPARAPLRKVFVLRPNGVKPAALFGSCRLHGNLRLMVHVRGEKRRENARPEIVFLDQLAAERARARRVAEGRS